jgi:hypothetical protein
MHAVCIHRTCECVEQFLRRRRRRSISGLPSTPTRASEEEGEGSQSTRASEEERRNFALQEWGAWEWFSDVCVYAGRGAHTRHPLRIFFLRVTHLHDLGYSHANSSAVPNTDGSIWVKDEVTPSTCISASTHTHTHTHTQTHTHTHTHTHTRTHTPFTSQTPYTPATQLPPLLTTALRALFHMQVTSSSHIVRMAAWRHGQETRSIADGRTSGTAPGERGGRIERGGGKWRGHWRQTGRKQTDGE